MAEKNPQPDPQEQIIKDYLAILDTKGLKITNWEGMIGWFKNKLSIGFTFEEIKSLIEEQSYDFKKVDKILSERAESKEALKKVEAIENKIETEEQTKKKQSQLNWIVSAFLTALVSAGSSWFISQQVSDIDTSVVGEAGGILSAFINGGWILAIASAFVGLFLIVMMLSEKYKDKKLIPKKTEQDTV